MLTGAVAAATLACGAPLPTAWAAPDGYCQNPPAPVAPIEDVPWTVRAYAADERLWPFSTGAGIRVAVLSTGVDADHPQLTGKVTAGVDVAGGQAAASADCLGAGTAAASVVAGGKVAGVGFYGLAPDAQIIPVRVSERLSSGSDNTPEPRPDVLAGAVSAAVAAGADVILLPHAARGTSTQLEGAVAAALAAGRIVVAAVGDEHPTDLDPLLATPSAYQPYPASYPGVIGVGAVGPDGARAPGSQVGDYVDLVAPGADVVAAAVGGQQSYTSTAIAASYTAATVALMLADQRLGFAALSGPQKVDAVTTRLRGTASPNAAGNPQLGYGAGLLDPYRALNEPLGSAAPVPPAPFTPYTPTRDEVAAARAEDEAWGSFGAVAGFGALGLAAGGFAVWVVRRIRSGTARAATSEVPRRSEDDLPEFVPGSALFTPKSVED